MFNSHRSPSRLLTAVGIATFLVFGTVSSPVAAEESKISSVEVRVNPELAPLGGAVKISGRTGIDHKTLRTVKISVKAPAGKREDLTAEADQNGDFSVDFAPTRDGDHIVDVTSPGGKDQGQTKFTVVGQNAMVEAVQTEQQALIKTAQDALETVETMLGKLPVSPAKDDVIEKLKPLKEKLAGLPSESAKLGPVMRDLDGVVKQSSAFGPIVYTSVFNPLAEWHREAGVQRKRIDAELALSRQANVRCDSLHQMVEALNLLSFTMTLVDSPFGILTGFAKSYDAKKISAVEKDPLKAALIARSIKTLPSILSGPMGICKLVIGLTTDIAKFAAQQYFAKYCEKFEGPVTGSMEGEYLHNGVAWRKWTQQLSARLTVRYAKPEKDGDAVRVTGEFAGRMTGVTNWDDAIPILFKKLEGTYQQFRRTVMPKLVEAPALDLAEAQGQVYNALGPFGFKIPIAGELVDRKLKLHVLPATTDISNMSAKVICFLGSPYFLGFINNGYELEFSKAHQMISAAMTVFGPEDTAEVDVVVDTKKKVMKIEHEFKGTRGKRTGRAYGTYSLALNLSNPP